ncbi:type II secretion system minor pseudopilin GspH [Thiomicrorhabdus sp. 6S3-12]|uniref:type II secretion system minor pseudopilin GspH n=1 Tax=Thiomicrorhabdus sp. 6S3-12 TaxID=2819681 RepID=UPI001AACCCF4|nr:type II secretion system minor pseudopilin GspH [Thiomicrorhabdus sp. 6S3-12]
MRLRQKGFTLIELMVVLLIIGLLLTAASLSFKNSDSALSRQQASQIQALFHYAQDQATWQQRTYLLIPDNKGVTLFKWQQGQWHKDDKAKVLSWKTPFEVDWQLPALQSREENLLNRGWWVLPSGEVQPGSISWRLKNAEDEDTILEWDQWLEFELVADDAV